MSRSRTAGSAVALLVVVWVETAVLVRAYAVRGTIWHFLLHSSIGTGLGLATAAVLAACLRRPVNGWAAGLLGQTVSIVPDFMFLFGRMPHERWMDVFVGHISIHTGPQPLLVGLAVFLLGGWAWLGVRLGHPAVGVGLAVATVTVLAAALALHVPLPTRLSDYHSRFTASTAMSGPQ